jgi:hypothetical protein
LRAASVSPRVRQVAALLVWACIAGACAERVFTNAAADLNACHPSPTFGWSALAPMVDRATLVVRGEVVRIDNLTIDHASVRSVVVRPAELLKGSAAGDVVIVEHRCPFFDVAVGDEWIAFLAPYSAAAVWPSPARAPALGTYLTLGGPEAVFTVRGGRVTPSGSTKDMVAEVLRQYSGRPAAQLIADIRAIRPIDGDVRAFFARFGWAPRETLYVGPLTLPPRIGFQNMGLGAPGPGPKVMHTFDQLAAVSREGGLDMLPYADRPGELVQILLERDWDGVDRYPPVAHAILVDRRIVGAWVLVLPQGDLYMPAQRAEAVAAPPRDPPTPTPIPNRFPRGVNLARDHALATTSTLSVKGPTLEGGTTHDRAVIAPIVEAFDVLVPTDDIPATGPQTAWVLLMWADDRFYTFEYWEDADLLVNRAYGYAAHPPARAIALLKAVR